MMMYDAAAIETVVNGVLMANRNMAVQIRKEPTLINWFQAQTMQAIKSQSGRADPNLVNKVLKRKLGIQ
jgi:Asp-tRNA(Asn)/Glu-tRNA(Gln) amidotransferase B subunit